MEAPPASRAASLASGENARKVTLIDEAAPLRDFRELKIRLPQKLPGASKRRFVIQRCGVKPDSRLKPRLKWLRDNPHCSATSEIEGAAIEVGLDEFVGASQLPRREGASGGHPGVTVHGHVSRGRGCTEGKRGKTRPFGRPAGAGAARGTP
jgi:hypothetical protein